MPGALFQVLNRWSPLGFSFSACWLAALSPASAWHISKELVTKKSRLVIRPGGMWPWDTENLQNVETELITLYSCLFQVAVLQQLAEGEQGEASNERAVGWPHGSLSESHSTDLSWSSTAISDSGDAHCGSNGPPSPALPSQSLNLYNYKMGRFLLWCTRSRGQSGSGDPAVPGRVEVKDGSLSEETFVWNLNQ